MPRSLQGRWRVPQVTGRDGTTASTLSGIGTGAFSHQTAVNIYRKYHQQVVYTCDVRTGPGGSITTLRKQLLLVYVSSVMTQTRWGKASITAEIEEACRKSTVLPAVNVADRAPYRGVKSVLWIKTLKTIGGGLTAFNPMVQIYALRVIIWSGARQSVATRTFRYTIVT